MNKKIRGIVNLVLLLSMACNSIAYGINNGYKLTPNTGDGIPDGSG